jgi:hypothetical protein
MAFRLDSLEIVRAHSLALARSERPPPRPLEMSIDPPNKYFSKLRLRRSSLTDTWEGYDYKAFETKPISMFLSRTWRFEHRRS